MNFHSSGLYFFMSLIKTDALLLKKIKFKNSSYIIQFYTREAGKVSVIGKGAQQMKSQFRGYLEPLNHLSIIYYHKASRDIQTLAKTDLVYNFIKNIDDIVANYYCQAILESLTKMVHHNEENQRLFDFTLKSLHYIDNNPNQPIIGLILFLLWGIKTLGYRIEFDHCHYCDRPLEEFYYDKQDPQPVCHSCHGNHYEKISARHRHWLHAVDLLDPREPINTIQTINAADDVLKFLLTYAGIYFDFNPNLNSLNLMKYIK